MTRAGAAAGAIVGVLAGPMESIPYVAAAIREPIYRSNGLFASLSVMLGTVCV